MLCVDVLFDCVDDWGLTCVLCVNVYSSPAKSPGMESEIIMMNSVYKERFPKVSTEWCSLPAYLWLNAKDLGIAYSCRLQLVENLNVTVV